MEVGWDNAASRDVVKSLTTSVFSCHCPGTARNVLVSLSVHVWNEDTSRTGLAARELLRSYRSCNNGRKKSTSSCHFQFEVADLRPCTVEPTGIASSHPPSTFIGRKSTFLDLNRGPRVREGRGMQFITAVASAIFRRTLNGALTSSVRQRHTVKHLWFLQVFRLLGSAFSGWAR